MITKYNIFLKKLRKKAGLSQDYVARKINVSRPTYVQIEKGERELSLNESQRISELFNISLDDLFKGNIDSEPNVEFEPEKRKSNKKVQEIRISVPQKNIEKFKEVLLYILEKVGAKPNIGETAIYKLLYFIEFDYYEKFEEQLIGATYIKNKYGPTPVEFTKIVKEMSKMEELLQVQNKYFQYDQKKYLPLRSADLSKLSARELAHIDDVLNRLSDKTAKELSDYSHTDIPCQIHKIGEIIEYESVFYRDHEHSVRNFDDEL